jgi:hypothetical protein
MNFITTRSLDLQIGPWELQTCPYARIWIPNRPPGAMAGARGQNPVSSSPGWTGEVVGSDKGLTTISFWDLDGMETWSAGIPGGGAVYSCSATVLRWLGRRIRTRAARDASAGLQEEIEHMQTEEKARLGSASAALSRGERRCVRVYGATRRRVSGIRARRTRMG